MTAPGDIVILIALLASVVACAGYAAGRLHQRRQSGADREEAYRHGFDSGTRSVFGMAARAAGSRRRDRGAVHGTVGVPAAPTAGVPAPPAAGVPAPPAAGVPAPPAAGVPGEPAAPTRPPAVVPGESAAPTRPPAAGEPAVPVRPAAVDPMEGGLPEEPTVPVSPQVAAANEGPTRPVRQVAPGFPAPPPPSVPGVPPPAATGGVTYTSLPDPRWSGGAELLPGQREPEPRQGRHTVPEELVQAATYVLPPDRVARAKVVRRPEDPPGPPVPRPRGS